MWLKCTFCGDVLNHSKWKLWPSAIVLQHVSDGGWLDIKVHASGKRVTGSLISDSDQDCPVVSLCLHLGL